MIKFNKKAIIAGAGILALGASLTACGPGQSDSEKASQNLSTAADNFEITREIRGVNTRTGKDLFVVTGRCSIDRQPQDYVVTCKHGPNDYRKHFLSRSNDTFIVTAQLEGADVSVYHTRIIIKPENLTPEIELSTGKQ
jgi:hypothetical protein